jgi:hypothetical protein
MDNKTSTGVALIAGHQYKDRTGKIHTLRLADTATLFAGFIALVQASETFGFEVPKSAPKLFMSDLSDYFYADFLNGACFVGQHGEGDAETLGMDLIEDVTAEMVNTDDGAVDDPEDATDGDKPKIVKLSSLKAGDKFTMPAAQDMEPGSFPTYRRTEVPDLDEVGSIVCNEDGIKLFGKPDDDVLLIEAATQNYPLRLPLVPGRRYVTRDGEVVTMREAPFVDLLSYTDEDGATQANYKDNGLNIDHESSLDIIAEADAPLMNASAAA